jgi:CsoR family transcriptional regulator, copper-sensing transcriptional repressor
MNAPTRPMRGYTIAKDDYQNRLRRIEGQVRGLQRMIDEDTYCPDVLTQIASVTKALESVALGLLDEHLRHCVTNSQGRDGTEPGDDLVDEAMQAFARLLKT